MWIGGLYLPINTSRSDYELRSPSRFELVIFPRLMAVVLIVSGMATLYLIFN